MGIIGNLPQLAKVFITLLVGLISFASNFPWYSNFVSLYKIQKFSSRGMRSDLASLPT